MSLPLDFVLGPVDLDEDYVRSFAGVTRGLLDDVDEGLASDVDSQELNGGSGSRSPTDSLFITDTYRQVRTPYSYLLSTYPQLRHDLSSSRSSVSTREDDSMADDTDGASQSYTRSETTPDEIEADGVCYGMVSESLRRAGHLADRVRYP